METKLVVVSVCDYNFSVMLKVHAVTDILSAWGYDYRLFVDYLWHGWVSKQDHFIRVSHEIADATHLMFIDAADVVLLCGPDELMERWGQFGHPWVYSAEPNIWSPDSFQPEDYPTPDVKYRYLNSGASVGEVAHIRDCFDRWTDFDRKPPVCRRGDQDWMARHFILDWPDAIKLDTNCDLFQCMCGSDIHTSMTPGKVHNNITGTDPAVIHFNGGTDITVPARRGLWEHLLKGA